MSILSESQDRCRPNIPRRDVFSMHCESIVHDVVRSSQSRQDPCAFFPTINRQKRILSVSCLNFDLQVLIHC